MAKNVQNGRSEKALVAGLEDGAVVMLAPMQRRIVSVKGVPLRRPRIGVRLRYAVEGELTLRDGRIAGGDVLCSGCDRVFARRVGSGTYRVLTVFAETTRDRVAAFGVVRFVDETAAKCQLALFEGEDPAEVTDDMQGGMGTDSGTIAMGEPVGGAGSGEAGDPDEAADDELEAFGERIRNGFGVGDGCQVVVQPRGGSVGVWRSGFGDGMYTPYWGVGRDGQAVFLAVDFGVIANGLRGPAVRWGTVGDSLELEPASWWRRVWGRK